MYLNLKQLFNKYQGKRGVGAFNIHCMEMLPYIIDGAKRANAPLIIQTSQGTAEYLNPQWISESVKLFSKDIDVCLHLDHCKDIAFIEEALKSGFNSVMYDGSSLTLEENIINTKKVVELAKKYNASVEGEIGSIGGSEDGVDDTEKTLAYTKLEDAITFTNKTDIDALAVAIGTVHGQYKGKANINFDLLKEISENINNVGLVLHGGTGVSDGDFRRCAEMGMRKLNVGTELNKAYIENIINDFPGATPKTSLRSLLKNSNQAISDIVYYRSNLLNLETK